MFRQKMVTPAIPERVYVLCRTVRASSNRYLSEKDLKDRMEPAFLGNNSSYFRDYLTAAEELHLVQITDGAVSLAVESSVIDSISTMRRYCNGVLSEFKGGQFFEVTKTYFDMGDSVLNGPNNVAEWSDRFKDASRLTVNAMELRARRFWFTFLGFGYLHDMFLIPNAGVFIKDAIDLAGIKKRHPYSFGEFVELIMPYSEIVMDSDANMLNFGVSNGLRTLHDNGMITLEHILDQEDIWSLNPLQLHKIKDTVTNITVNK